MKYNTFPNVGNSATRMGILKEFEIIGEGDDFICGKGILAVPRNYKENGEYHNDYFAVIFPQKTTCQHLKSGMFISVLTETLSKQRPDGSLLHYEVVKTCDFRKH